VAPRRPRPSRCSPPRRWGARSIANGPHARRRRPRGSARRPPAAAAARGRPRSRGSCTASRSSAARSGWRRGGC
jgi:hypothetical protein